MYTYVLFELRNIEVILFLEGKTLMSHSYDMCRCSVYNCVAWKLLLVSWTNIHYMFCRVFNINGILTNASLLTWQNTHAKVVCQRVLANPKNWWIDCTSKHWLIFENFKSNLRLSFLKILIKFNQIIVLKGCILFNDVMLHVNIWVVSTIIYCYF